MTEAEWLAATDPTPMLHFLKAKTSARKLRLFAVACCRTVWERAKDEQFYGCLETVERFADGLAADADLRSVFERTRKARRISTSGRVCMSYAVNKASHKPLSIHDVDAVADACAGVPFWAAKETPSVDFDAFRLSCNAEYVKQTGLVADVFGNPFRHVTVDPTWLTSTAVAIAHGIYDERAFDRLPILADALQDAGCEDADVLGHCRGDGVHVRGCWVVDGVLGKG
ncbi:hypothetical protein [Limnoglobus roseus]|uniref:SMI1/KNR4 family protein n=1 Tax=Limnoglobus roseus TaxID=2598579 RepID=A0A5C1AA53_9BACT|nr:hypothetical protein [Limnoglobus roseus]QEL15610.1 SMI1/KNR4 family protein [Limnoglobus roseus]